MIEAVAMNATRVPRVQSARNETRMSGKEFDIVGWKAKRPIHFKAGNRDRVGSLIDVCDEEIALIDSEIREFSIPFPQQLMPARRRFQVEVHPEICAVPA